MKFCDDIEANKNSEANVKACYAVHKLSAVVHTTPSVGVFCVYVGCGEVGFGLSETLEHVKFVCQYEQKCAS